MKMRNISRKDRSDLHMRIKARELDKGLRPENGGKQFVLVHISTLKRLLALTA